VCPFCSGLSPAAALRSNQPVLLGANSGSGWDGSAGHGVDGAIAARYHTRMTSTDIRAIVRAELRRFLLHAADSFPPLSAEAPAPDGPLTAALDALSVLGAGHGGGLTTAELMSRGASRGEAWRALVDAVTDDGAPVTARTLGRDLGRFAGRRDGAGRRLEGGMHSTRKVRRWRVVGGSPSLDAFGQARGAS